MENQFAKKNTFMIAIFVVVAIILITILFIYNLQAGINKKASVQYRQAIADTKLLSKPPADNWAGYGVFYDINLDITPELILFFPIDVIQDGKHVPYFACSVYTVEKDRLVCILYQDPLYPIDENFRGYVGVSTVGGNTKLLAYYNYIQHESKETYVHTEDWIVYEYDSGQLVRSEEVISAIQYTSGEPDEGNSFYTVNGNFRTKAEHDAWDASVLTYVALDEGAWWEDGGIFSLGSPQQIELALGKPLALSRWLNYAYHRFLIFWKTRPNVVSGILLAAIVFVPLSIIVFFAYAVFSAIASRYRNKYLRHTEGLYNKHDKKAVSFWLQYHKPHTLAKKDSILNAIFWSVIFMIYAILCPIYMIASVDSIQGSSYDSTMGWLLTMFLFLVFFLLYCCIHTFMLFLFRWIFTRIRRKRFISPMRITKL